MATGSPIAALNYRGGILLFTLGRERQKLFEIYDRIALGALGHPGDIERLRMTAIELASAEGFARSSSDVSLRRMANYSLSPALKAAFEQVYGPPYLARLLFAELGAGNAQNTFLRVDYDGAIQTNGTPLSRTRQEYAALSATHPSADAMEKYLAGAYRPDLDLPAALRVALDAWTVGFLALGAEKEAPPPAADQLRLAQREQLDEAAVEAAVLEQGAASAMAYRMLTPAETGSLRPENG